MTSSEKLRFSILVYTPTGDTEDKEFIIPTIQNININESINILSKPTITGENVSQYGNNTPVSVTINILIQTQYSEYEYLGETFNPEEILNIIKDIGDNKLQFDLITTDDSLKDYLTGLTIKSKTFSKSSQNIDSIVCTINCIETRFAKIGWNVVSKLDVLGTSINTDDAKIVRNIDMARKPSATIDFEFQHDLGWAGTWRHLILDTPPEYVGEKIDSVFGGYIPDHYLHLTSIIDLSIENTSYNISTEFPLKAWIEDNIVQTGVADFGNIKLTVDKMTADFTPHRDIYMHDIFVRSDSTKFELHHDTYNIFAQYGPFGMSESFNTFLDRREIQRIISLRIRNKSYTYNEEYLPTDGTILLKTYAGSIPSVPEFDLQYIMAKDISKMYKYTIEFNDEIITYPVDAFKINVISSTIFNCDKNYNDWQPITNDAYYNEHLTKLFIVNIGLKLYIFIFSPDVFLCPLMTEPVCDPE